MKPVVIFDFFGVFCTSIATDWFKKNTAVTPKSLETFQALCTESDYGKFTRAEFNQKASALTGVPVPEIISGIEAETNINTPLVSYAQQLQTNGYRLACLSNGTHEWTLQVITDHGLGGLFEQVVLSGDVGIVKPSQGIYRYALELLDIKASEAVFVDDRQANVDAAITCGMRGLLFSETTAFISDFEQLEAVAGVA